MFARSINDLLDGDPKEWSGPIVLTWNYDGVEEDFEASRCMQFGLIVISHIDGVFSKRMIPWMQVRSIEYAEATIMRRPAAV